VLYEMATGQKAFTGKSRASLIGAILKDEPPAISKLQPMTPPALDRVVRTCLAKDPEDRWQTARDLALELKWVAEGGSAAGIAAPGIPRARQERLAWFLAILFGVGLAATLALSLLRRAPETGERRALKLSLLPPEKTAFAPGMIALSRDGSRLAFVAAGADGESLLWIRPLDSLEARPLAGTEGAYGPFWSWDGRFLGFFAEGKLKKIEASGGPPQTLYNLLRAGRGGAWNAEGVILFAPSPVGPLFRISDAGGVATPATKLDEVRQENSHRWPVFLPDGRHFLYYARSRQRENRAVFVGSLDSTESSLLMSGKSNVLFAPGRSDRSGYLLFEREGWLVARKLSVPALRFDGDPFPIAKGIQPSDPVTAAMFTVSENGVLAYGEGAGAGKPRLVWFDRSGRSLGSLDSPGHCLDLSLSPDQKRVALNVVDFEMGGSELWQIDLARGVSSRLTVGDREAFGAVWSPDGERIVFTWIQPGAKPGLYEKPASGAGKEDRLLQMDAAGRPLDWSADGRFLLFQTRAADRGVKGKLWVLPFFGERKPFALLGTPFDESSGAFSPDGKWVAYVSDESGRPEVYVQTFPISNAKWRISTNGGRQPRWRGDGREIFYVAPDNRIMAVAVKSGSSFEAGIPSALFRIGTEYGTGFLHQYAVTRDGERFLVILAAETHVAQPITVVFNWESDLKK
jgi:Tol biopolymer transport system component